jgi:hypothetical protein
VSSNADRGAWIQTHTGRRFHYADPRIDEIHIEDIAHALGMLCRYAGHVSQFFSVAEHSVLVSRQFADPQLRLIGLLHDATEAYCVDIPRPLKRMLPEYEAYEDRLWCVIAEKFGLPSAIPTEIHEMDTRMLMTERPQLFRQALPWPKYEAVRPLPGVLVSGWGPTLAKLEFLETFRELERIR